MTLPVGFLGDDGVCRHGSFSRVIFGSGHLYHSQQVAAYMPGLHKVDKLLAYEPAVYKKVVKAEAFKDGPLDLPYSVIQLALEVLIHTLGCTAVRITLFAEASFRFLLRQTLRLGLLLSHLTLKGEVNEGLGHAISTEKEQALVAKDTLVLDVRENTSQQLSLPPNLGKVGIIHYQTHRVGTLPGVTSGCYSIYKAARKAVQYLPPVDVHISQKAVEHVFVAHEQLTEHTLGVVPGVLDGEEREQDRQTEDLLGRELAVLGFGKPHLSLGNLDMVHHVHHSLNRFRIITFRKKAADFRNNVPIFVHAKGFYVSLFGDTNIVIINEICNISQRNQP